MTISQTAFTVKAPTPKSTTSHRYNLLSSLTPSLFGRRSLNHSSNAQHPTASQDPAYYSHTSLGGTMRKLLFKTMHAASHGRFKRILSRLCIRLRRLSAVPCPSGGIGRLSTKAHWSVKNFCLSFTGKGMSESSVHRRRGAGGRSCGRASCCAWTATSFHGAPTRTRTSRRRRSMTGTAGKPLLQARSLPSLDAAWGGMCGDC